MFNKTITNRYYVNNKLVKPIKLWLLVSILLVFAIIVVGGITRLTDSGLSITEWKPVTGIIPPFSDENWIHEFSKYQASPEYLKINKDMTLGEFKFIYLWEYAHRLLGRLVGIFFALPFAYLLYRKAIGKYFIKLFGGILFLGFLQGFFGWFMVKSGLVDYPHVSQYRLALHFSTAVIISVMLTWGLLKVVFRDKRFHAKFNYKILGLNIWILVQIISGAFVAGLDAGLVYNTFPLMDSKLIPDGLFALTPFYTNFFENIVMVQFIHRLNAMFVLAYSLYLVWYYRNNTLLKLLKINALIVLSQAALGVLTLIYQVPMVLGVLHQLNAVIVMLFASFVLFIASINRKATAKKAFKTFNKRNNYNRNHKFSSPNSYNKA
ncbi:COX15/CtaA family protein [Rickettsiales endosymbiont of Stachyamoeba lipophora]|uniref:COX15/CtaA family protein n=1 Tax=Rickettsiales endosymbiont of Stachyamoeba lipophora TaxID=2486578 RepID=UPI000F655A4B|nr:COX15/CtaA family protein [Rickettsiales endosymbiont of Stachyamoeba lipophora]AZL15166.1 heme A synthase [Rickettsiales endosymbiont of Stachyamoeba lipophora]